jgi:NADH-quinone oxidoreductase subunit N
MQIIDISALAPELFMAVMALVLLLAGLFVRESKNGIIHYGVIAVLATALFAFGPLGETRLVALNGMIIDDAFGRFAKTLLLGTALGALIIARPFQRQQNMRQFEYPVLVLLAAVGMMLMVSAKDFLALYVGLELQSLALYVLAAFRRDDPRASEAGLKYFVLGALASGLLLFGISLIYGLVGSTNYFVLKIYFGMAPSSGLAWLGMVFVLVGIGFKISAAPFHMWTPDVYEGAPTPVTAFLASAAKIAAFAVLARLLMQPLLGLMGGWQPLLIVLAILSMLVGAFTAIRQNNIKRLLAYSTITHVGYMLTGLAAGGEAALQSLLIYLAVYVVNTLGVFAVILALRQKGQVGETIPDLAGLSREHPLLAFVMTLLMFSLAGVPPLAGFYGKFYVFMAAWKADLIPLVFIGLLSSAVAAYYYLRIIKLMYFDDRTVSFDEVPEISLNGVIGVSVIYVVLFGLYPVPVINAALIAAQSLLKFW